MRTSKYSKEFKNSTVQLVLNNNESVAKVANDLGINSKTLYLWIRTYKTEHNLLSKSTKASTSNESTECKLKRRYKNTTDSNHNLPIAPNILDRDFYASNSDEKYVGDITYIQIGEGCLYLATIIDLYSRKVVVDNMKVSLVNDALNMAMKHRNPPMGLL